MSILVPDTSSLINLSEVFVGRHHITDIIKKLFDVRVCSETYHELKQHKDNVPGYERHLFDFAKTVHKSFWCDDEYEKALFNAFSPNGNRSKNKGERHMCSLSLYLTRKREVGHSILLIDDMRAIRGMVEWFRERFKVASIWNSIELLLHVYLVTFPKWPLAQARISIKAVNAKMSGDKVEIAKRLVTATRHLNELHSMLNSLPKPRSRSIL